MSYLRLLEACSGRDVEIVAALLRRGADPNGVWLLRVLRLRHQRPLEMAVSASSEGVVELLLKMGADPNWVMSSGRTPLSHSAFLGRGEVAQLLLEHGADPNLPDREGVTPIEQAMWRRHQEVVELLEAHGAVASAVRKNGHKITPYEDLMCSIKRRDAASVERLVVAGVSLKGGRRRRWCFGDPGPLHAAVYGGSLEVVETLMRHGADVNALGNGWGAPIAMAAYAGDVPLVKLLLDYGADINRCSKNCASAIEEASWYGRLDVLELLLERGGDPHLVLERGSNSVLRIPESVLRRLLECSRKPFPEAEEILASYRKKD